MLCKKVNKYITVEIFSFAQLDDSEVCLTYPLIYISFSLKVSIVLALNRIARSAIFVHS